MNIKKIFALLILTMLCLTPSAAVMAAPLEDLEIYDPVEESTEVTYIAGEKGGGTAGEGSTSTEIETEGSISSQNASVSRELRGIMQKLIEEQVIKNKTIYKPGTSLVVQENIQVPYERLAAFMVKAQEYEKVPGWIKETHRIPTAVIPSVNTNQALDDLQSELFGNTLPPSGNLPIGEELGELSFDTLEQIDTSTWPDELVIEWRKIIDSMNLLHYREDIIGGGYIDWPYLELRYRVLQAYVESLSMEDTINTTLVTEYRITKDETQKIVNKQPIEEYKWEIYDSEGNLLKTAQTYGRTLRLSFNRTGTYFIKAYQRHYVTRADVISTAELEYWMLSDTKQIMWKNEKNGTKFYYDRNVTEEYIQTNFIKQVVTSGMLEDNWFMELTGGSIGITEGFQTERIQ